MRIHLEPRCEVHAKGDMKLTGIMRPCVVCGRLCNTARMIIDEDEE
jgi:hypothetical protein